MENEGRSLESQASHNEDILGIVAHELRNPLAPIKAAATLLEKKHSNPDIARLTKIIHRQLAVMERIVEDLVDITRAHSGKLRID